MKKEDLSQLSEPTREDVKYSDWMRTDPLTAKQSMRDELLEIRKSQGERQAEAEAKAKEKAEEDAMAALEAKIRSSIADESESE